MSATDSPDFVDGDRTPPHGMDATVVPLGDMPPPPLPPPPASDGSAEDDFALPEYAGDAFEGEPEDVGECPEEGRKEQSMSRCGFGKAWTRPCNVIVTTEGERCAEHANQKCSSCGAPPSRQCDETMGPFVCGAPLCADCEHTLCSNGCSSDGQLPPGAKAHCRKDAQVFKGWYEDGAEEHNAAVLAAHR